MKHGYGGRVVRAPMGVMLPFKTGQELTFVYVCIDLWLETLKALCVGWSHNGSKLVSISHMQWV